MSTRRLYFETRSDGTPRMILKRSNTHSGCDERKHHHLTDHVRDHVRSNLRDLHRAWHHHPSDDRPLCESPPPVKRKHKHREALVSWEDYQALLTRYRALKAQCEGQAAEIAGLKQALVNEQAQNATLVNDNTILNATIKKFVEANRLFADENRALRAQLATERSRGDPHHRELRALQREVQLLRDEKAALSDKIDRLNDELKRCGPGSGGGGKADKLLADLERVRRERDVLEVERGEWRDRYDRLVCTVNALRDRVEEEKRRADKAREEADRCRRRHQPF